jgi:alanyl-tRNA synthetase
MTPEQIERVEKIVNDAVAADYTVKSRTKSREEAISEGAMALFGEKYGEVVRTISILPGDGRSDKPQDKYSYELCGGTHLSRTSDVGAFIIVSEGSAAAGVRRIEAVTGRGAYELISRRFKALKAVASSLKTSVEDVPAKVEILQDELSAAKKQLAASRAELALSNFNQLLPNIEMIGSIKLLVTKVSGVDKDTLTRLSDAFRAKYPENGICVIASTSADNVVIMSAVMQDLIKRGIKAGDLVSHISRQLGAGGGGAPHLAFGGGKDLTKLDAALASVKTWLAEKNQ